MTNIKTSKQIKKLLFFTLNIVALIATFSLTVSPLTLADSNNLLRSYTFNSDTNDVDCFTFDSQNDLWLVSDNYAAYPNPITGNPNAKIIITEYAPNSYSKPITSYTLPGNNDDYDRSSNGSAVEIVPQAIAIDSKGDIWVLMSGGLYEFPANSPSTARPIQSTIYSGSTVTTMAADKKGNIWITGLDVNASPVNAPAAIEFLAGSTPNSQPIQYSDMPQGFSSAGVMAIDPNGNVWLADGNGSAIVEIPSGSSPTTLAKQYNLPKVQNGSSNQPQSVISNIAADSAGNIWAINSQVTIDEIPSGSSTQTLAKQVVYSKPNVDKYGDITDTIYNIATNKSGLWFAGNPDLNGESFSSPNLNNSSLYVITNGDTKPTTILNNDPGFNSFGNSGHVGNESQVDSQGNIWFYYPSWFSSQDIQNTNFILSEYLASSYRPSTSPITRSSSNKSHAPIYIYIVAVAVILVISGLIYYLWLHRRHRVLNNQLAHMPLSNSISPVPNIITPDTQRLENTDNGQDQPGKS